MKLNAPLTFAQGVLVTLIAVYFFGFLYGTTEVHERLRKMESSATFLDLVKKGGSIEQLYDLSSDEPQKEEILYLGEPAQLRSYSSSEIDGFPVGSFHVIVNRAGVIEAVIRRSLISDQVLSRVRGEPLSTEPHGQPNTGDEPIALVAEQSTAGETTLRVRLTNITDEEHTAMPIYASVNLFIETPRELRLNNLEATSALEVQNLAPGQSFEIEFDIAQSIELAVGRDGMYKCNLIYDPAFVSTDAYQKTSVGRVKSNVFYVIVRDYQVVGIKWPEEDDSSGQE